MNGAPAAPNALGGPGFGLLHRLVPAPRTSVDTPGLVIEGGYRSAQPTPPPAPHPPSQATQPGQLRGQIDLLRRDLVEGWARDGAHPEQPVVVAILLDGTEIARLAADQYRPDLERAGVGGGRHGFSFTLPALPTAGRHVVAVRRASDGVDLAQSPGEIAPWLQFDAAMETQVRAALAQIDDNAGQVRALAFLLGQTENLLQRRSARQGWSRPCSPAHPPRRPAYLRPDRAAAPRALIIDDAIPSAGRGGESGAILAHMRALQDLGYDVSFFAAGSGPADASTDALQAAGVTCCGAPTRAIAEAMFETIGSDIEAIYLHRVSEAATYLALIRQYVPGARVLLSLTDFARAQQARRLGIDAPCGAPASEPIKWAQVDANGGADPLTMPVTIEAALLRQSVTGAAIPLVPRGATRPIPLLPFSERNGVVLLAGHGTVCDDARFLVEDVMPLAWQTHPGIECRVLSRAMPQALKDLQQPGVAVVDAAAVCAAEFGRVRLTVALARSGGAPDSAILASLAAGLPCALTPGAAAAIGGTDHVPGCLGEGAAGLAAVIIRLHEDADANARAAAAGLELVARRRDEATVLAVMQAAVEGWGL